MKKWLIAGLGVLVLAVCSSPCQAAFPRQINYQGKLTNASGVPLSGTYSVVFAIYDASSGGTTKWTETQNISAESGFFNVLLGSVTPIDLNVFDGNDRWLGVKVGADSEMTPRHQLVSVGHAFKANDSDKLGGQLPSYYLSGSAGGVTLGPLSQQTTASATAVWVKGATNGVSGEGATYGVYGTNGTTLGYLGGSYGAYGKYGNSYGYLGTIDIGVYGESNYPSSGIGVYGYGTGDGVYGLGSTGVRGKYDDNHYGYLGSITYGVYGKGDTGIRGEGTTGGVYGKAVGGYGVYGTDGTSEAYLGYGSYGVYSIGKTYGLVGMDGAKFPAGLKGTYGVIGIGQTGALAMCGDEDIGAILGDNTNAVYGWNGVNTEGWIAGASYGAYGGYGSNHYGYLGSANYGGYAQYDAGNKAFIGGSNFGVSAEGTTYGVYGYATDPAQWAGYFAGKLKTTDTGGTNHVYDIAELIPCAPEVGPADVVVINPSVDRQAKRCDKESDPKVIGIISADPQLSIGDQKQANQANPGKNFNFIALAGQVPCKVSIKNGPIYPGDLLTTSDIPGHAVKSIRPGTIVAKALETFDGSKGETGKILVFVNVSWFGGTP